MYKCVIHESKIVPKICPEITASVGDEQSVYHFRHYTFVQQLTALTKDINSKSE